MAERAVNTLRDVIDRDDRWLHSDMKDAAYFYVHPLFINLVNTGGLK
ncbi:MAG: hypothetical protein BWX70_01196 [Verrucomicrobia bacterium ADurb.Bin070]|jgi:hypothetical protein|nr:MAG: hypothetical protein BWX70_01196 [Verrucomicrobia bacterium ADurb.Bin070]